MSWVGPNDPWDDQIIFVFDGGTLTEPGDQLTVSDAEISAYRFVSLAEAANLLRPDVFRRLHQAHDALVSATTYFDEVTRRW